MRKTNDKPLKEVLEQMFKVYKIKRKFDETAIVAHWSQLVGAAVANRTKELYVYERKLFLRIESSVIKNELMMMRGQIIEKINSEAGDKLIDDIIFL